MTLGPLAILCILGVTFFIGSSTIAKTSRKGDNTNDSDRGSVRGKLSRQGGVRLAINSNFGSSRKTFNGSEDEPSVESGKFPSRGRGRGGEGASHAIMKSEGTGSNIAVAGEGERERESPLTDSLHLPERSIGAPQRTVRSILEQGPGEEEDSDEVGAEVSDCTSCSAVGFPSDRVVFYYSPFPCFIFVGVIRVVSAGEGSPVSKILALI